MIKNFNTSKKNRLPVLLTCLVLIALLVGFDQWTKADVVASIPLYERIPVIPGFFDLTYVQNTGAAFSMFDGMGIWFFVILTVLILAAMVYAFWKANDLRVEICLALIMAGALGNLIDRIQFGYVRDFFLFYIFGSPFPVFNVADVCITIGFIGLAVFYILDDWKISKKVSHEA